MTNLNVVYCAARLRLFDVFYALKFEHIPENELFLIYPLVNVFVEICGDGKLDSGPWH